MSTDLKLSKAQISKIIQSVGFLGSLLSKLAGPLMKVSIPLAKNVLVLLGIAAAASAINAEIQKKVHNSGTTNLITLSVEMNDIMKNVQAFEDSNILLKGFTKTIKNETKKQKGKLLSMLLGTLGVSLSWFWETMGLLMPPHPLTNFEIQRYYQNEPRFNGVFSRNNLPKTIKDGAYVINLD